MLVVYECIVLIFGIFLTFYRCGLTVKVVIRFLFLFLFLVSVPFKSGSIDELPKY